ncbi:MAG: hypothetical protein ABR520_07530 [Mycobacteriales bacterium]
MTVSPETDPDDVPTENGESAEDVHGNVRESGEGVEEPAGGGDELVEPSPRVSELPDGPEGMRPVSWGRN